MVRFTRETGGFNGLGGKIGQKFLPPLFFVHAFPTFFPSQLPDTETQQSLWEREPYAASHTGFNTNKFTYNDALTFLVDFPLYRKQYKSLKEGARG